MTSFSFFKYFDAFELDVNVFNFVYYGKTLFCGQHFWCLVWATYVDYGQLLVSLLESGGELCAIKMMALSFI